MARQGRYRRITRQHFGATDPIQSLRAGIELAAQAGAKIALAGRLAVWFYVPPEGQQLTKDADLAISRRSAKQIADSAARAGYKVSELTIGGYGLSAPGVAVDLIHRQPHMGKLFSDAVKAANARRLRLKLGKQSVPVAPIQHLIAMKLAVFDAKDERDIEELLRLIRPRGYPALQSFVRKTLGYPSAARLDALARRIGHPGPGMPSRYREKHRATRRVSPPRRASRG